MGATATHKASTIIENTAYVLGIELLAALQALEYRKIPSSPIIEKIKDSIRKKIAPMNNDRYYNDDIIKAKEIVLSNEIIDIASEFIKIL
jgi:histidine ammonia-lyase